jgi:hypothetical protein
VDAQSASVNAVNPSNRATRNAHWAWSMMDEDALLVIVDQVLAPRPHRLAVRRANPS